MATEEHLPTRESLILAIAENLICRHPIILLKEPDLCGEVGAYASLRRIVALSTARKGAP